MPTVSFPPPPKALEMLQQLRETMNPALMERLRADSKPKAASSEDLTRQISTLFSRMLSRALSADEAESAIDELIERLESATNAKSKLITELLDESLFLYFDGEWNQLEETHKRLKTALSGPSFHSKNHLHEKVA